MGSRTLTQALVEADAARIVQLSDTHLSHRSGVPAVVQWLLDGINADPPDLVVVSGDIVYEDPDDDADRTFAHDLLTNLPCPVLAIPGNHDIGFYNEVAERERRIAAFTETWGADRFSIDVAGWRLVGANAYLLGEPEHDSWLRDAVSTEAPVAVFIHQPQGGEPVDGWETPPAARSAFDAATSGADIRVVASGHSHRSIHRGRVVWAPSTTIVGETHPDGTDPTLGAVELIFGRGGAPKVQFLRPNWAAEDPQAAVPAARIAS